MGICFLRNHTYAARHYSHNTALFSASVHIILMLCSYAKKCQVRVRIYQVVCTTSSAHTTTKRQTDCGYFCCSFYLYFYIFEYSVVIWWLSSGFRHQNVVRTVDPFVLPLDGRKRKRVVRVPGVPEYTLNPFDFVWRPGLPATGSGFTSKWYFYFYFWLPRPFTFAG